MMALSTTLIVQLATLRIVIESNVTNMKLLATM